MSIRMAAIIFFALIILMGLGFILFADIGSGGAKTFAGAHFVWEGQDDVPDHTFFLAGHDAGRAERQGDPL